MVGAGAARAAHSTLLPAEWHRKKKHHPPRKPVWVVGPVQVARDGSSSIPPVLGPRGPGTRPGSRLYHTKGMSTHDTPSALTNIFSLGGSEGTPAFLPLLLLTLSGDIETNPGPTTYPCPTCQQDYNRRVGSIQCPQCWSWTHYNTRCAGVRYNHAPPGWLCLACHPTHNITPQTTTQGSATPPNIPTPASHPSPPQRIPQLNILQLNIDGIRNKHLELKATLKDRHIHIAVIQETKLQTHHSTPKFPGYTTLRHDRSRGGGGGLITLIHTDIPFTNTTAKTIADMPIDRTIEIQTTRIRLHTQDINIVNLYIPPTSSTPAGYTPQLDHLNSWNNTYILGDLNAHDPSWLDAQTTDLRGTHLLQQLDTFMILNNTSIPTRLPYNILNQPTSPDVSLATSDLGLRSTWRAGHELSSDHRPLYISLTLGIPIQRRPKHTFTNYKHADWHNFSATIEDSLQSFDISQYINIRLRATTPKQRYLHRQ